ncbi:MAG: NapC/NirT family cytochrome c [Planctomycetota bacterium]
MTEQTDKPVEPTPPRPRWQRLLGWRHRPGRRLRYLPTKWGCVLILAVGGLLSMGGLVEYTMQPDFCRSCHIMEPYYQAWHASAHKNVPCADCHFEPGLANTLKGKWQASSQAVKYITGTFGSKPHAEVRDESCLREGCHERRILEGKVKWTAYRDRSQEAGSARKHETTGQKKNPPGGERKDEITIQFDHAPHMQKEPRGMTLRCVSCHSQIVQGQHIVITLDTCYLCHFKGRGLEHGRTEQNMTPAGCRACHNAPQGKVTTATGTFTHEDYIKRGVACQKCHAETIKGDGGVPKQVCWNCHNVLTHISRYGETKFMHENHVTNHKVDCSSCHVRIEHNLGAAAPKRVVRDGREHAVFDAGGCGLCHTQTHGGPMDLYRGVGGRGVPAMPSPMFRTQVNCAACHKETKRPGEIAEIVGQTFQASQQCCTDCHGNKYDGEVERLKKIIATSMGDAEKIFSRAQGKLQSMFPRESERPLEARRALDDAAHNIRFVKLGHGVHNVNYAVALLNAAVDFCRQAEKALAPPVNATGGRP